MGRNKVNKSAGEESSECVLPCASVLARRRGQWRTIGRSARRTCVHAHIHCKRRSTGLKVALRVRRLQSADTQESAGGRFS